MSEEKSYYRQMLGTFQDAYKKYNDNFKILSTDSPLQKVSKKFGRLALILFMILLSPFMFIGLFMAFIAVF